MLLLDRPNPLDAVTIAGPMLDPSEASFVKWKTARLHEIIGPPAVTRAILELRPLSEIEASYQGELEAFRAKRQKFLLYR